MHVCLISIKTHLVNPDQMKIEHELERLSNIDPCLGLKYVHDTILAREKICHLSQICSSINMIRPGAKPCKG